MATWYLNFALLHAWCCTTSWNVQNLPAACSAATLICGVYGFLILESTILPYMSISEIADAADVSQ